MWGPLGGFGDLLLVNMKLAWDKPSSGLRPVSCGNEVQLRLATSFGFQVDGRDHSVDVAVLQDGCEGL